MNKEYWILTISNDHGKSKQICTGMTVNGLLKFEPGHEALRFASSREARYRWYKFQTYYPTKCQGYFAKVTPKNEVLPDR